MASQLASYLPQAEGLLPKWLLLLSVISIGNSIQAYSTLTNTREVYSGPLPPSPPKDIPKQTVDYAKTSPVTPLSARTFGTWTALASIVRLYAAYHITNPQIYEICLWTYVVAWCHFMSEWWVFGSARWGRGLAGPIVIANVSLVWMWAQWGWYVQ